LDVPRGIPIDGHSLTLEAVEAVARSAAGTQRLSLDAAAARRMRASRATIERLIGSGEPVYGMTTGFGRLAEVVIAPEDRRALQHNLIRSHASGVGEPLPRECVRAIMLLRANALARGYSGCRPRLVERLLDMLDRGIHPVIPEFGSVGASGDLAPLAHVALSLLGEGYGEMGGQQRSMEDLLAESGLAAIKLGPKEGLALINGTQATTALGVLALLAAERALVIGADVMSSITDYEDRATCILFGDAGGAVLLEAAQDGEGILGFNNQVDGSGCDLLKMPAGGSIRPPTHETVERKEHYLQQQGKAFFRFAVRNSADAAEKLLAELGFSRDEVSFLVCHQANARIIDAVARRLQLPPERVVKTIHKYGNTTAASIPTALRDALDRSLLAPGDLVLFSSVGAGLTIGTAAIRWGGERTAPASAETNSTGP